MSKISTERRGRHRELTMYFIEESQKFVAVYQTELGTFRSYSICCDEDIFNAGIGEQLAERRVTLKYYQARRKKIKVERKTLVDFYSSVKDMNAFNEQDPIVSKLRRAIYEKNDQLQDIEDGISSCLFAIDRLINKVKSKFDTDNL